MLAFATLPVGVLAVAQGYAAFTDTKKLRRTNLASEAFKQASREQSLIHEAFGGLDVLRLQVGSDMPVEECTALMRAIVTKDKRISFAGVAGEDGVMRCGYPLSQPLDLTKTPEYGRFIADPRRTVTVYQRGAISKRPVVTVSEPIWRGEHLAGSIALSLPSAYIDWASAPERDSASRFAILDNDGAVVAKPEKEVDTSWLPDEASLASMMARSWRPTVAQAASGEARIYTITPLFERDVFAVSSWPEGRATGKLTLPQMFLLLLPLVMWGMAIMVAYFAVDRFALRHVVYLDRLVSAYAHSNQSLRASGMREAPLEFAALGKSFDHMAQEIERREDALRHSLDEKDALLKEVYHRVRNNLQMIVSLMNLQLRSATGEQERETLQRLQARILGLAAVHKRLSEAKQVNAIRIDTLLQEIVENARETREEGPKEIALKFDTIEHVEGPDRALPLAMFTAEAVANAFRHGMGRGGRRALRLTLCEAGPDALQLVITNAHKCMMTDGNHTGLGSQLIDSFARQMRGKVDRDVTPDRYTLRLTFPRASTVEES